MFGTDRVPDKSYRETPYKNIMNLRNEVSLEKYVAFNLWSQIDFLSKISKFANEIPPCIVSFYNSESYFVKYGFGQLNLTWKLDISYVIII